jgi:branched-chain amino acid transport system substrate-binding protein
MMKTTFAKTIGIYAACLVLMLTLFAGVPFGAMASDTVKIGLLEPFSGPFEAFGRNFYTGVQFAVDEQNAKGGLLGKKVEIIKEDDELKPDVATRKAKKLILEDKIDLLSTGMGSHVAIALSKLATSSKIIYINYAAMADDIQGKEFSRYAFRVCQNVHNSITSLTLLMAKEPYRKFYGIYPDYAAGHSTERSLTEMLKTNVPDAKIVGTDFHPLGSTKDFGPYITKVIASGADAVVTSSYGTDLINLVKQARAMGLKAPFPFFATLAKHPYTMNELKDDAVGLRVTFEYSLRVKTPENEEMIKRYHQRHRNDKDFLTWWPFSDLALGILGWKMTFAAVEKAGSLDPEKIIEAFENFQWKSPVGLWTMRKCDHQVILPMFGGVIEGGPNPFYDGSIRPEVKFPWMGPNLVEFPADKIALPPTPQYNPRCR